MVMNYLHEYSLLIQNSKTKNEIWQTIQKISDDYQKRIDSLYRKNSGIFYTGLELADAISKKLISCVDSSGKKIYEQKLLEPCVGIGNFIFSYIKNISTKRLNNKQIETLIDNIYVCDIDENALKIYQELLSRFVSIYFDISLDDKYWKKHLRTNLSFNLSQSPVSYKSFNETFSDITQKFDIVITNPPYKNLKANENTYDTEEDFNKDKYEYKKVSEYVKQYFTYANEGVLNLYKIFIEDIVCNYTQSKAFISLLIPNTILSDKTCNKLRTLIIERHQLASVLMINENNKNIDAQQAMVALLIKKGEKTSFIEIEKFETRKTNIINYNEMKRISLSNILSDFSDEELNQLRIMSRYPKIKDIDFIINKRGELDLTTHKNFISENKTNYPLLRGKNISLYAIKEEKSLEYVKPEFLKNTSKRQFIEKERLVCQQISNINSEKRLKFTYVSENFVLGNSCNFLSVTNNKYGFNLYALLGILNSNLLNWYFKLISSNNHINNYELDEFPIPIYSDKLQAIGDKVKSYLISRDEKLVLEIENLTYEAYGIITNKKNISCYNNTELSYIIPSLNKSQSLTTINELNNYLVCNNIQLDSFDLKVAENIIEKREKLFKNNLLNHTTFKLSNLDMEMIVNIPQGGNWQNIPDNVIQKSERLKKIKQSGGRTTLYGRLDYSKPSYTITTYFNRPGNGTYVHPIHNRVISVREAARLQSFCDDYYFIGNKSDMLKQVGNAVPPLLAFQIAKQIKKNLSVTTCIDLFCGAGGMTQGFKKAGYETVIGVDFDQSACLTYKVNNPEINTICADLTDNKTKEYIINIAKREKVDLICGGPPCQGFSMAGKRFIDDPRNQLFKEYLYLVDNIKPKVFVFENVEGLLTFQHGLIYQQILDEFSNIGYNISAKMLKASDYAVPQKRKRIILIGVRKDISIDSEQCYPKPIKVEDTEISVKNAIYDLEKIECHDCAKYEKVFHLSSYIQMLRKEISFDEFLLQFKTDQNKQQIKQLSLFAA